MNAGSFASLIDEFAKNWAANQPNLILSVIEQDVDVSEDHPLHAELFSLCSGGPASLPFYRNGGDVHWCTVAANNDKLRMAVSTLNAWLLPSFGGAKPGDGYISPDNAKEGLVAMIIAASPDGYYRWRCPRDKAPIVLERFRLERSLESVRPSRVQPPRPSLYELRARFAAALLIGDRDGAEAIIGLLDSLQLETAINTQFMRIRLWHYFGELDRIRDYSGLPLLLTQPLPPRVRTWIDEAQGISPSPESIIPPVSEPPSATVGLETAPLELFIWSEWFDYVKTGNRIAAESLLDERPLSTTPDLSSDAITCLIDHLEELYMDEALRSRERSLILQGVAEILQDYVREPGFPQATLGGFYLALLRLWGILHAGISIGQEHGHVLLELASAALRLNIEPKEVLGILEKWWRAKRSPSQISYVLDAIELLARELPYIEAIGNLWLEAAETIKRTPDTLPPPDRILWRQAGILLGFDSATIEECLPLDTTIAIEEDILSVSGLKHIAIVCLREEQAEQAAKVIRDRSGAQVTVVTSTVSGAETTTARQADVVLFVWLASTHAVFRAFDGFDRKQFCYVQGTGSSSIVRSLERWAFANFG